MVMDRIHLAQDRNQWRVVLNSTWNRTFSGLAQRFLSCTTDVLQMYYIQRMAFGLFYLKPSSVPDYKRTRKFVNFAHVVYRRIKELCPIWISLCNRHILQGNLLVPYELTSVFDISGKLIYLFHILYGTRGFCRRCRFCSQDLRRVGCISWGRKLLLGLLNNARHSICM
jgi:hypothetical protein